MDAKTAEYYATNAARLAGDYTRPGVGASPYFSLAFNSGSRVLDIGCGVGRDVQTLIDLGFDAVGMDASDAMLTEAKRRFPVLEDRLHRDELPDLAGAKNAEFDGVLCWAVLMHVPEERLFDTLFNLRRILKRGGRLLISTPLPTTDSEVVAYRDNAGRLFNGVTPENFQFLLEKVGFRSLDRWDTEDQLGRPDRRWSTQLFVLQGDGSRSLDKIEGILNRDKKDATYKPALFRALAELASTNYQAATWLPEGKVSIPISLIADKWLEYFWPLLESEIFIPQKRGEKRGSSKPIAFRAAMHNLIDFYKTMGGLCGFSIDHRSDNLPGESYQLHRNLHKVLCNTIRVGPVHYSGGGGSKTLIYDKLSKGVLMDADLWRELSLMGSWIMDATVLRWAELTAEISQGALKPSQVIDQLLTAPIPEREVQAARSLYQGLNDKVCVWTNRPLKQEFDVDHVIPFSLWRNNDLWNLLPSNSAVNNHKRDRLPTRKLLYSRKDCVIHYWSLMRESHPVRFEFEVEKLTGPEIARRDNWENPLFAKVAEAIEYTAIQRGVERWQPLVTHVAPRSPELSAPETAVESKPKAADETNDDLILYEPPAEDRFIHCVPYFDLEAAAGAFGPEHPPLDSDGHSQWARVSGGKFSPDMFVLRVVGKSMEPKIPDHSLCLFRGGEALVGTRQGRILLVVLRDSVDPETSGRLTVKRYSSKKAYDESGEWRHTRIELSPLNPEFSPIVLEVVEEDALHVVGEFVRVIR